MYEKVKLDEAKYFYSQMVATFDDRQAFTHNLSAFLSAARSVLQYALEEAGKKTGGQRWYDRQMSASRILKEFKDKRDVNIHKQPVSPTKNISVTMTATIGIKASASVIVRDANGNIKYQSPPETPTPEKKTVPKQAPEIKERYIFSDWSGPEGIMELCQKYLDELEYFVEDGIKQGFLTG